MAPTGSLESRHTTRLSRGERDDLRLLPLDQTLDRELTWREMVWLMAAWMALIIGVVFAMGRA